VAGRRDAAQHGVVEDHGEPEECGGIISVSIWLAFLSSTVWRLISFLPERVLALPRLGSRQAHAIPGPRNSSPPAIENGRVVQESFRDYPLLTIAEMPQVEIASSRAAPLPAPTSASALAPILPLQVNHLR
jgi:hypothetical protein